MTVQVRPMGDRVAVVQSNDDQAMITEMTIGDALNFARDLHRAILTASARRTDFIGLD
ncbi:MAG: hypothetical protein ACRYGR_08280 [Janthinobacterium lividum]